MACDFGSLNNKVFHVSKRGSLKGRDNIFVEGLVTILANGGIRHQFSPTMGNPAQSLLIVESESPKVFDI